MKSLKRAFQIQTRLSPNCSTYICLLRAVKGKGFTRRSISTWFRILVDRDDYDRKDRNVLVMHLHLASMQIPTQKCATTANLFAIEETIKPFAIVDRAVKIDAKNAAVAGYLIEREKYMTSPTTPR